MDAAIDNYFALSDVLREDLLALLETESDSQHWRRNYVRVSASLIEGYAHCLREMCAVSFECVASEISENEVEVIRTERSPARGVQTVRTTTSAELWRPWPRARRVLNKRHLLMHPKTPADLEISNELWFELRDDVTWLVEQFFNFIAALQAKHGG